MESPEKILTALFAILERAHESEYIGESISQLEHALQCAKLAFDAGKSHEFVISALLHDLGQFCAPSHAKGNEFGIDDHPQYGSELLAKWGFSETVVELVKGHVEAKRYLVSEHPKYLEKLSPASQETLRRQGGPMSEEERERFRQHPLAKDILGLRVFDDQAKRLNWKVPPLSDYQDMILSHLKRRAEN